MLRERLTNSLTAHVAVVVAAVSRVHPSFTRKALALANLAVVVRNQDELIVQHVSGKELAFAIRSVGGWDVWLGESTSKTFLVSSRAEAARRLRERLEQLNIAWVGDIA